jgi:hypothetical protein
MLDENEHPPVKYRLHSVDRHRCRGAIRSKRSADDADASDLTATRARPKRFQALDLSASGGTEVVVPPPRSAFGEDAGEHPAILKVVVTVRRVLGTIAQRPLRGEPGDNVPIGSDRRCRLWPRSAATGSRSAGRRRQREAWHTSGAAMPGFHRVGSFSAKGRAGGPCPARPLMTLYSPASSVARAHSRTAGTSLSRKPCTTSGGSANVASSRRC